MLCQIIQEVDRKGSRWTIQKHWNECIGKCLHGCWTFWSSLSRVLNCWSLSNHSSVAGANFKWLSVWDGPSRRGGLELTETDYSCDETFTGSGCSPVVWSLTKQSIASVVHAKVLGTEHVSMRFCTMAMLGNSYLGEGWFFLWRQERL